jgi:glyoxylate reductase
VYVLIATELRELLDPDPVPGHAVQWISSAEPTPAGDAVAIIPLLTRRLGREELVGFPGLRIIANCAVGYDNVDLDAARERGVVVTNTPDVLTAATADLAWTLILAVARRVKEAEALAREGGWTGWDPVQLLGLELQGRILGIVGAGRIGQAVGRRAIPFGMRVCYADRAARPEFEVATSARLVPFETLLAESDVISVHVPSTFETRGMFGAAAFRRMKPGALFINTARGDLVDEASLIAAVERGHLGGVGLDVYAREPHVPERLRRHPRVLTLPHVGSATTATRRAMASLAARNVIAVLSGRPPLTPVRLHPV